jgi:hypothetical protein
MAIGAQPKTALFANFQGGSLVVADQNLYQGRIWFLNGSTPGATDSAFYGRSPLAPTKTLAYTATQLVAGDTVIVGNGHSESISTAGGVTIAAAGVLIIGITCGGNINGGSRPAFNFITSNLATFKITGTNVCMRNLSFDASNPTGAMDANAGFLVIDGGGAVLDNLSLTTANAINQSTYGIVTTANAFNLIVQGCYFQGSPDAGTTAAIKLVGATNSILRDNYFIGAYSSGVGAIQGLTTDSINLFIQRNVINNVTSGSTKGAVFTAGSTGMIIDNRVAIGSGAVPFTGTLMNWMGNYVAAAPSTNGTLI